MVNAPDQDARVDDLRQRLRALGYLDAGVDRFVLAPARDARAPWVIALFASLRIGGLAALLLGPATAIGLSARLPSLVTGTRDALIIAIYFAIFFGLAIAAAAFALSLVVSWTTRETGVSVARRAPLLSRVAGAVVTLGCLAYLTLWWQTVIAGVGWSAPAWTASALALAAAISLLLGHAVTVGSSAVVLAGSPGATTIASLPRTSNLARWGARLAIGLVAFGGAALLLTWSDRASASDATPQMLMVVPSGMRVRVIAIDGLDPMLFEGVAEAGVPHTLRAALNTASIRFINPRELEHGQDPARAWTTIATGHGPYLHGVKSLETRRLTGVQGSVATSEASAVMRVLRDATDLVRLTRPSVASGRERRVKTFWEVAASAGLNTVAVNWWATWPATDEAGIVLSDRATLRLDRGGTLDAEISPALLYDSLRDRWPTLKERANTLAVEAAEGVGTTRDSGIGRALVPILALDAQQILLFSEVSTPTTDLAVVYLPGLDILRYTVRVLGQDVSAGEVAERYVQALDHLLASLLTPGPDEIVMIVTQPGRATPSTDGLHTIDLGRLSARGTSIAPGKKGRQPDGGRDMRDAMDLAPTILHALGVPISRELGGKPLLDLFTPDFIARYPVREVATYGPPSARTAARSGQPLDQETIDRLRSLGYLK